MEEIKIPKPFNVYRANVEKDRLLFYFGYVEAFREKLTDNDVEDLNIINVTPNGLKELITYLISVGLDYEKNFGVEIGIKNGLLNKE